MKLKEAIESLGVAESLSVAINVAREIGVDWEGSASFVFNVIVNDLNRVPGIGARRDDEEAVIRKWVVKYQKGKDGRASSRASKPLGTVADPIIDVIIGARAKRLGSDDLNKITYAHRVSMSAENILGSMLEEYLSENLLQYGWHCAWGETVKSVDFVHEDGSLLQIKNRSNSENSSSRTVRDGTSINKWYRIKADRVEYMWDGLNSITGAESLSENSFSEFVKEIILNNPGCLAVEDINPWL